MVNALTTKDPIYYQGHQVFLTFLDKKSCFACSSPKHEVKACKSRILRYQTSCTNKLPLSPSPSNFISPSGLKRSYSAILGFKSNAPLFKFKTVPQPLLSFTPSSIDSEIKSMLTNIASELDTLKHDVKRLHDDLYVIKEH